MPYSDAGAELHPRPIRILVVEDEVLIRHDIAEALRALGASVVEAATGDEAWDYLRTYGQVDLLFTDYRMPGSMNGGQLASYARTHYPDLQVVLTSGHFLSADRSEPVLRKPYPVNETAAALFERACKSRSREI
ncbi:MAG TPA: response regulator [Beijerinckiaceae bacterium]|nr:response regulator [Beijerinckiaceae bacterium]